MRNTVNHPSLDRLQSQPALPISELHMRIKITICFILVVFTFLLASLFFPLTQSVTLTFIGRPAFLPKYSDGSLPASFIFTNSSARLLYSSPGKARIQTKTRNGWTNFVTDSPDDRVQSPIDRLPIGPYENWWMYRHVPQNHVPWRLQVTYIAPAPQWTRLKLITSFLNIRDKEYSVYSEEMPGEPAR